MKRRIDRRTYGTLINMKRRPREGPYSSFQSGGSLLGSRPLLLPSSLVSERLVSRDRVTVFETGGISE